MASTPAFNPSIFSVGTGIPPAALLAANSLSSIEASTQAIEASLAQRESEGVLQEGGRAGSRAGNTTIAMPSCPPNGPLGFVYEDLFNQAKANLGALNSIFPSSGTPEEKQLWVNLIARNRMVLRSASNIAKEYLFPAGNGAADATESVTNTMASPDKQGWPVAKGGGEPSAATVQALASLPFRIVQQIYVRDWNLYQTIKRVALRNASSALSAKLNSTDLTEQQVAMIPYLTPYRDSNSALASLSKFPPPEGTWISEGAWAENALFGEQKDVRVWTGTNEITGERSYRTDRRTLYSSSSMLMAAYRDIAREYSRLDLRTMLLESYSFYTFNALVYFADLLGLTPEQIREQQTSAVRARTAASTGTMTAVATLANPIFGVIAGALAALVDQLVAAIGAADGNVFSTPFSLFRRIPRADCPPLAENVIPDEITSGVPAGTPGVSAPCTPPCATGSTCVSGACQPPSTTQKKSSIAGPVVVGASLLFLLSLLRR